MPDFGGISLADWVQIILGALSALALPQAGVWLFRRIRSDLSIYPVSRIHRTASNWPRWGVRVTANVDIAKQIDIYLFGDEDATVMDVSCVSDLGRGIAATFSVSPQNEAIIKIERMPANSYIDLEIEINKLRPLSYFSPDRKIRFADKLFYSLNLPAKTESRKINFTALAHNRLMLLLLLFLEMGLIIIGTLIYRWVTH